MNRNLLFQVYYPRSKQQLLLEKAIRPLFNHLTSQEDVVGALYWNDTHKGENIAVYIKGGEQINRESLKSIIKSFITPFLAKHPGKRESVTMDDYLFMDFPTNTLLFDDAFDNVPLVEKSQTSEVIIANCLNKLTAELSIPAIDICLLKDDWKMVEKMLFTFNLCYQLLEKTSEVHECDRTLLTQELIGGYLQYFSVNTSSPSLQKDLIKAEKLFFSFQKEINAATQNEVSPAENLWLQKATSIVDKDLQNQAKRKQLLMFIFIQLKLSMGLGPDTSIMLLAWLQIHFKSNVPVINS